ncbi:hypothetical protein MAPG_04625 [Magnaporthiopsis poae ATCC 64411]|uniref:FAR1 domain-containing protein n=1 Tax=Magnaporthiopsis poae (strain ATCC 64411 / 73-15) TaxID=644358 RepID=A0A0C4DX85_MAGP6|nr:hypothetical protein MAPG_04625 [Magnaporthiopsis poae ATCC 64411]
MTSLLPALPPEGYPTADQAQAALKKYAYNNGFDLAIHERYPRAGEARRITFRCAKGPSQMTACPYKVNLKLVAGLWRAEKIAARDGTEPNHNHELLPAATFSSFRQQNLREN